MNDKKKMSPDPADDKDKDQHPPQTPSSTTNKPGYVKNENPRANENLPDSADDVEDQPGSEITDGEDG
jgi:hypothetical protein